MSQKIVNRLSFSGLSATFIGVGVGRFAYIALMPALIQAGWFSKSEASYLGSATLLGYLFGALLCQLMARRYFIHSLLRGAMLACSLSYLACALIDLTIFWYYFWRFTAGFSGAVLMILAAPAVLPHHNLKIRGRVSGVVFSGIGLGAMASGTLIPFLIQYQNVSRTWLVLGIFCLLLTFFSWNQWKNESEIISKTENINQKDHIKNNQYLSVDQRWIIAFILIAYIFNAIGYLPHTLFWVDYIVRELKMPLSLGGFFWAIFGVGAALGPILTGYLGDRFGFKRSLIMAFSLKAFAVILPLLSNEWLALLISSFLVGMFTPGIVTLISTYTLECVGVTLHRKMWGFMTFAFSVSQAIGGYLMAFYAGHNPSYRPLFLISSLALILSVIFIGLIKNKKAVKTAL